MSHRLAEKDLICLTLCLAQYYYYEKDSPIMDDWAYDNLEIKYRKLLTDDELENDIILNTPGCGENLIKWLKSY